MIHDWFQLMCPDSLPTVLGLLDPSIAPPFLYYSYIPIVFVSLLFGAVIYMVDKASLASRLFLWISILFSLLLCGEILLWVSAPVLLVQFVWEIMTILHVLVVSTILYFVYVFVIKKDVPAVWPWVWFVLLLPIFILTPTHYNLPSFDLLNCQSNQGPLWYYVYFIEALAAALGLGICLYALIKRRTRTERVQAGILGVGLILFLGIFIFSYVAGDVTLIYNFNLLGPLGMVAFLTTITYLIVQYHVFNLRVIGAQALVIGVEVLLFAALFVRTVEHVRYVLFATIVLVGVLGAILVRGVLREIEQRRHIEQLAKDLEKSNEQQVVLIHFITHQIKGFVTKSRNIFAALMEGDYGQLPEPMKPLIEEGFRSDTKGASTIQQILDASNIKSGKMTYANTPFDLKELVDEVVKDLKVAADAKNLALTVNAAEGPFTVTGDRMQMLNAVKNLIDNSIKYTPSGSVTVSLTKEEGKVRLQIEDTGVGITPEDMQLLFTEGGHGKESTKVNVDSTGFGLYIVRNIIEAHKGKVWAESEGAGKGSRFIAEIPA